MSASAIKKNQYCLTAKDEVKAHAWFMCTRFGICSSDTMKSDNIKIALVMTSKEIPLNRINTMKCIGTDYYIL